MKWIKSTILCTIFTLSSTLMSVEQPFGPRRLTVLFDPHGRESSITTDFAIMSGLIAALEQQAAPILISESLWHNFVIRRFRYDRLKDKSPTGPLIYMELLHTYGPILTGPDYLGNTKTIEKLRDLYATHYGYYKQALQVARTVKGFNQGSALRAISVKEKELQEDSPLKRNIDFDLVCYKTHFDPKEWSVFHIPHFIYLLIPKKYEEEISKGIRIGTLPLASNLTTRELILGLKIYSKYMFGVADPLKIPEESVSGKQFDATDNADLNQLFVTRRDLGLITPTKTQKSPETYENYLGIWNIYLTGHGKTDTSEALQEQIRELEKAIALYTQGLTETTQAIEKYTKEIAQHQAELRKGKNTQYHRGMIEITQNTINNIKDLKRSQELRLYELRTELINLYKNLHAGRSGGIIAGLYIDEFKDILNFFNTEVRGGLFFYDTCFGSGKNLEAPYQYQGIGQAFNYTIASGAFVDAPTTVGGALIPMPPYKDILFLSTEIRNNQEDIKILVSQHFDTYYKELEEYQKGSLQKDLADILNTIHAFKGTFDITKLHNIPLIRFAHTSWFKVVDMKKWTLSITEQSSVTHQAEKRPFNVTSQQALLLYTAQIPVPITIKNKMPAVISMIGGDADHYVAELNAPNARLSELVHQCMPIEDQYFTKRFLIKKLTCLIDPNPSYDGLISLRKGDLVTLHDVIIINNDREYFTDDPHNKVNVLLFTYTGVTGKEVLPHRAVWPAKQKLTYGEIPDLTYLANKEKAQKQLKITQEAFALKSKPSAAHAEQLAGRQKLIGFVEHTAHDILQKYRELLTTNPQGIANWIKMLPEGERKLISVIHYSEMAERKPQLTKKEFEAVHKRTAQPPIAQAKSLSEILNQLTQSLQILKQRLG